MPRRRPLSRSQQEAVRRRAQSWRCLAMPSHAISPLLKLHHLPASLPLDGAVRLELHNGLPVLRASTAVQQRSTALLRTQQENSTRTARNRRARPL